MFALSLFLVGEEFLCKVTLVCRVAFGIACSCSVVLFSWVEVVFELVVKLVFGICGAVSICILSSGCKERVVCAPMKSVVILSLFAYVCADVEVFWKGVIRFLVSAYEIFLVDLICWTSFSGIHFGQFLQYAR